MQTVALSFLYICCSCIFLLVPLKRFTAIDLFFNLNNTCTHNRLLIIDQNGRIVRPASKSPVRIRLKSIAIDVAFSVATKPNQTDPSSSDAFQNVCWNEILKTAARRAKIIWNSESVCTTTIATFQAFRYWIPTQFYLLLLLLLLRLLLLRFFLAFKSFLLLIYIFIANRHYCHHHHHHCHRCHHLKICSLYSLKIRICRCYLYF